MRVALADTAHDFIMVDRSGTETVVTLRRGMCLRAVDRHLRPELTAYERAALNQASREELCQHGDANDLLIRRVNERLRHAALGCAAQPVTQWSTSVSGR